MKNSWQRFRQLCGYYRDCLRFDAIERVRLDEQRCGDSWIPLPASVVDACEAAGDAGVVLAGDSAPGLRGLLATARNRSDWSMLLGRPALVIERGDRRWTLPLMLRPVRLAEGARIVMDGPLMPNLAALDVLLADRASQQDCLEACGLVPRELESGSSADAGDLRRFDVSTQTVEAALGEQGLLPPAQADAPAAVLAVTRRGQFHRRLGEELYLLSKATSEDCLAASALAQVFSGPAADPSESGGAGHGEVLPVLCERPLDPDQVRAITAALHQDLTVVTGPPGCGKSTMVRHVLVNQALRGRPTLVTSRNHRALDAVEPALNRLGGGETFIVRTSHHGQQRSWKEGLLELLDEDRSEFADIGQAQRRFGQALADQAQAEADCLAADALAAACAKAEAEAERWHAVLPLPWRMPADQLDAGSVSAIAGALDEWRQIHAVGGLRRLLPPGQESRRKAVAGTLRPLIARFEDAPGPDSDWHAWDAVLERLQAVSALHEARAEARRHHARLDAVATERPALLARWEAARAQAWQAGIALLRERAAGSVDDPEAQRRLGDLRAAVATFGLARCEAAYGQAFPDLLHRRPLWACSNLSAPATLPRGGPHFDLLIIDEASQCDIPSIIPLLARCRRVLVVGDPRQLGHISGLSAQHEERLLASHGLIDLADQRFAYRGNSAFALLRGLPTAPPPILLGDHHRCHPAIADLVNRAFYRNRLRICTDTTARLGRAVSDGVHWHAITEPLLRTAHGACAPAEADHIADLVADMQAAGETGTIGIITPFRAQVDRIRAAVERRTDEAFRIRTRLLVATAHGFQGDERSVIFFSLCAGPDLGPGAARFLAATPNLFNVAISRARRALHLVGNRDWAAASGLDFIRHLAAEDPPPADADAAAATPESTAEQILHDALAEIGIATLPQYRVAGRRIDLAIPHRDGRHGGLAIEVDGRAHHATASGAHADDDSWRDLILTARGWRVLRFWATAVMERSGDCAARVAAELTALQQPGS